MFGILKKIWQDPVGSKTIDRIIWWVLGGILLGSGISFWTFWDWISKWSFECLTWCKQLLIYKIPIWYILIILLGFLILFLLINMIRNFKKPLYMNYNEDILQGLKWRWAWINKKKHGRPNAYCPNCDRLVSIDFSYASCRTEVKCINCNFYKSFDFTPNELLKEISSDIDLNVRKNTYPGTPKN